MLLMYIRNRHTCSQAEAQKKMWVTCSASSSLRRTVASKCVFAICHTHVHFAAKSSARQLSWNGILWLWAVWLRKTRYHRMNSVNVCLQYVNDDAGAQSTRARGSWAETVLAVVIWMAKCQNDLNPKPLLSESNDHLCCRYRTHTVSRLKAYPGSILSFGLYMCPHWHLCRRPNLVWIWIMILVLIITFAFTICAWNHNHDPNQNFIKKKKTLPVCLNISIFQS